MKIHTYNSECIDGMKILPNESVDIILTDPPYKYLKNQKLEVDFDETAFFNQVKRVLKKGGFIVLFGRGTSFYRWNYTLSELGFEFKEEVIWDKVQSSSPLMVLSRVHETISIYCRGKGKINKIKVPYLEMKKYDIDSVIVDVKRLKSILNNPKSFDSVISYLEGYNTFNKKIDVKNSVQVESHIKEQDKCVTILKSINNGMNEKSVIKYNDDIKPNKFNSTVQPSILKSENRSAAVARIINDGMVEKSIIKQNREHYISIHPTQKPVRLLERLLKLVIPSKAGLVTVIDPFAGSFSTCEAVKNIALEFPENEFVFHGWELDKEYYDKGMNRLNIPAQQWQEELNW